MIIVVEGIDRVGKTTLCSMLSKKLGIPVFKNEPYYRERLGAKAQIELTFQVLNMVECFKQSVILDRLHLSEFVYGFYERGYVNNDVWDVDEKLAEMGAVLVLVRPTDLSRSSMEHGKDLKKHSALMDAMCRYSKMKKVLCDYKTLDYAVDMCYNKYMEEQKKKSPKEESGHVGN